MTNIIPIHQRELEAVQAGLPGWIALKADEFELDRLYHTWIPLLSTYVTHDSIEAAIDEWYAMIKQPGIWLDYIEEAKAATTRPFVVHTLESWKNPFIFAGRKTESRTFSNWGNQKKWQLPEMKSQYFIGLALPLAESQEALLVHFFEADEEFFDLLEDAFEESCFSSRQQYLNNFYLTCLSFLSDNS